MQPIPLRVQGLLELVAQDKCLEPEAAGARQALSAFECLSFVSQESDARVKETLSQAAASIEQSLVASRRARESAQLLAAWELRLALAVFSTIRDKPGKSPQSLLDSLAAYSISIAEEASITRKSTLETWNELTVATGLEMRLEDHDDLPVGMLIGLRLKGLIDDRFKTFIRGYEPCVAVSQGPRDPVLAAARPLLLGRVVAPDVCRALDVATAAIREARTLPDTQQRKALREAYSLTLLVVDSGGFTDAQTAPIIEAAKNEGVIFIPATREQVTPRELRLLAQHRILTAGDENARGPLMARQNGRAIVDTAGAGILRSPAGGVRVDGLRPLHAAIAALTKALPDCEAFAEALDPRPDCNSAQIVRDLVVKCAPGITSANLPQFDAVAEHVGWRLPPPLGSFDQVDSEVQAQLLACESCWSVGIGAEGADRWIESVQQFAIWDASAKCWVGSRPVFTGRFVPPELKDARLLRRDLEAKGQFPAGMEEHWRQIERSWENGALEFAKCLATFCIENWRKDKRSAEVLHPFFSDSNFPTNCSHLYSWLAEHSVSLFSVKWGEPTAGHEDEFRFADQVGSKIAQTVAPAVKHHGTLIQHGWVVSG